VIAATLGWHDRHFRVIAPAEAELVRSPRDDPAANTVLAATNKCLARSNKSCTGAEATKSGDGSYSRSQSRQAAMEEEALTVLITHAVASPEGRLRLATEVVSVV
jgi:hypothetical protein